MTTPAAVEAAANVLVKFIPKEGRQYSTVHARAWNMAKALAKAGLLADAAPGEGWPR